MLPAEVLRTAASLIRAGGLSQGCHARDAHGTEVDLFVTGGQEGKASVNPAAEQFSIYGAVTAACARNACNPTAVWVPLDRLAREKLADMVAVGGSNYLHPLICFSEHMDTTKEKAAAFLEQAATLIEAPKVLA